MFSFYYCGIFIIQNNDNNNNTSDVGLKNRFAHVGFRTVVAVATTIYELFPRKTSRSHQIELDIWDRVVTAVENRSVRLFFSSKRYPVIRVGEIFGNKRFFFFFLPAARVKIKRSFFFNVFFVVLKTTISRNYFPKRIIVATDITPFSSRLPDRG